MVTSKNTETVVYGENNVTVESTKTFSILGWVKGLFTPKGPNMTRIECQSCGYTDVFADMAANIIGGSHEEVCKSRVLYFFL